MKKLLFLILFLTVSGSASAVTPEQEEQLARMRLAAVCQGLLIDGLVTTCTVDRLLGK